MYILACAVDATSMAVNIIREIIFFIVFLYYLNTGYGANYFHLGITFFICSIDELLIILLLTDCENNRNFDKRGVI